MEDLRFFAVDFPFPFLCSPACASCVMQASLFGGRREEIHRCEGNYIQNEMGAEEIRAELMYKDFRLGKVK